MKNLVKLVISVIGCELVGVLGTPFTISAIPTWYAALNKPIFAPPNWIFGPVWTTLYLLMGIAFYLIWKQDLKNQKVKDAIVFFLTQLTLNFLWTPIFFGLRSPGLGLVVIGMMWVCILITIRKFYGLSQMASYLLVPYFLWVSFATILNASIFFIN